MTLIKFTRRKIQSFTGKEWLIRQLNDPYVKKAQELNYRARSAFKLIEIDDKFKLMKNGMKVVECGAAPGAWSQIIVERINSHGKKPEAPIGKVIGIDLLRIEPLHGAIFFSDSDFTNPEVQQRILKTLNETEEVHPGPVVDLILSDMAPNASGILSLDHEKLCGMVDSCLKFAIENCRQRSSFVAKVWTGSELEAIESKLKTVYKSVNRFKPKSSRQDSAELYLVAQTKK